jgi:L-ribulose-5-phosphate 4-epimerase
MRRRPLAILRLVNNWIEIRQAVLDAAQLMLRDGLVVGTSGNVSARCTDDSLAITASGTDYAAMTLEDIVVVDFDGEPMVGDAIPSTEMLMHSAIYRARPGVGAVMHTHSAYASGLAIAGQPLPPLIDEIVVHLGGVIEVSEYAFPGTEELGDRVVAALGERNAALIRNHGLVGVGKTPAEALRACQITEHSARIYSIAKTVGVPQEIPADAVATEIELFRMHQAAEAHLKEDR